MILRPLEVPPPTTSSGSFISAWHAVEPLQRAAYDSCWMITQPSHAALAGEIAAKLSWDNLPQLGPELVRAIALHDAGWGMPDAQAVMSSRSVQKSPPRSFLQVGVPGFLTAWTQSIEVALSTSPAGGYMVSRHFWRLAEHRLTASGDTASDRAKLQDFLKIEGERERKLVSKQDRSPDELEALTDVLQFCDLLSLYFCCGAQESVEFPEYFGMKARVTTDENAYRFDPPLLESGAEFSVAALRHPALKQQSGREINFKIW